MNDKMERKYLSAEELDDMRYESQEDFFRKLLGGFFLVSLFACSIVSGLFTFLGL